MPSDTKRFYDSRTHSYYLSGEKKWGCFSHTVAWVELTKGQIAIVDTVLLPKVLRVSWCVTTGSNDGKLRACGRVGPEQVNTSMHRYLLGLGPSFPVHVDHVNRNPLDNRLQNLRLATPSQNRLNSGPRGDNTSGYKGVTWDKSKSKWQAQIRFNGTNHFIGRFDTAAEAARAYDVYVSTEYPTFGVTNQELGLL